MGKIKKLIYTMWIVLFALLVIYVMARIVLGFIYGYSWQEMDWNGNGSTTLSELFISSDVGKRNVQVNNENCIEYFSYKDGLPIKTICHIR